MMTASEALILSKGFPKDRDVPRKIYAAMTKTRGDGRKKFEQIVEGLFVDCRSDADFNLIDKYFGD